MSRRNSDSYLDDPNVQLMLKFKDGDKSAFEELLQTNFKSILNFIYRYIPQKEIAEELTQEIFIKVYQSAEKYEPKAKFKTWVLTMARNMSLNEIRRKGYRNQSLDVESSETGQTLYDHLEDDDSVNPSQELAQKEREEIVRQALDDLPENQKTAVILRRYEQMSYDEIAETMGTTSKAVKSLLNRAKENLKKRLEKLL